MPHSIISREKWTPLDTNGCLWICWGKEVGASGPNFLEISWNGGVVYGSKMNRIWNLVTDWHWLCDLWESLIIFWGLSLLICKMGRIVPALLSLRVAIRIEWDSESESAGMWTGGGRVRPGGEWLLRLWGFPVKSVSCPGVGRGLATRTKKMGRWTGLFWAVLVS